MELGTSSLGTWLVIVAGLVLGSFLNVCIYRIPRGQSIVSPGSRCPQCERPVHPWHNVPVLSYLWLRGKCAQCGKPISAVYPTVEILSATIYYMLFLKYGFGAPFFINVLLFSLLVVLVFIDLFERILPDVITLPGLLLGFLLAPVQSSEFFAYAGPARYLESFLGMLAGGGTLWLVAFLYLRLRKIEGMGFGDVKMMAMVGAFLGWRFAWVTIFLGSLLGAVIGSLYIFALQKGQRYELPFGTFLGGGAVIATLWGPALVQWYFGML
ncbi:MAG: prepilin peptidase [Acidobacteriota bacterium]